MPQNKQFPIYPDPKLKKEAEKAAKKDGRSLNGWILNLIKKELGIVS